VRADQNPIDRMATGNDWKSFQEGEIELTERKEIPVLNKEARVVEEIRLHKEVEEHDETIHEKIRDTEVDIDKIEENDLNNSNRDKSSNELTYDWDDKSRFTGNRNYQADDNRDTDYNRDDWTNRNSKRDGDPLFGA
jgi:hypothetical protein